MNFVELLSPAGDVKSFKAVILAGANAIFFGVSDFNARQRAENISFENLIDLIKLAKSKNVKSYLTLNTLVFDSEFSLLVETVKNAVACGVDAVIVQDLGVLSVVKKLFPELEIHASTQMTTHNILQCEFLSEVGVSQINLSRELSLDELKPIVKYLNTKNIIAEIFVHGAYCISFSGQCYFSNYLYGEAGNRGLCVQPCRREFISNNKNFTPFNLKDNCAINFVKELKELGNISLKIEGRIKSFDYVWAITKEWKNALENNLKNLLSEKNNLIYNVMNRSYSDDYLKGEVTGSMFTFGSKDHSFVESGFV
ncbi:MAG: U32 family peptidase, partial [Spirochaetaceae bacterium]|nr:U32 family peptidase [Spirochaetaceae bacterium]